MPRPGPRAAHALALALLAAAILIAFSDVLPADRGLYFRDHANVFRPRWWAVTRSFAVLELPALTRASPAGVPIQQMGTAAYTPLTLVLALGPFDVVYDLFVAAHFFLLGLGAYVLARALRATAVEGALAASVAALSGPMLSNEYLHDNLTGFVFIPWFWWGLLRLIRAPGPRAAGLTALALGFHLQGILPETLFVHAAAFAMLLATERTKPTRRHAAWLAAALVLGAGIAMVEVLPVLATLDQTRRGRGFAYWEASASSIGLPEMVELFAPAFWNPPDVPFLMYPRLTGTPGPYLLSLYLGVALALVPIALSTRKGIGVALAGLLFFLIALGPHTPLHGLIVQLPLFSSTRYPVKYTVGVVAALAALAPIGLRALDRAPKGLALTAPVLLFLALAIDRVVAMPEALDALASQLADYTDLTAPIIGVTRADFPAIAQAGMRARLAHAALFAALITALGIAHAALPARRAAVKAAIAAAVALDLGVAGTHLIFGAAVADEHPPVETLATLQRGRVFRLAPNGKRAPVRHEDGHTYFEDVFRSQGRRGCCAYRELRLYDDEDRDAQSNRVHAGVFAGLGDARPGRAPLLLAREGVGALTTWLGKVPDLSPAARWSPVEGEVSETAFAIPGARPYVRAYTRWRDASGEAADMKRLVDLASDPALLETALVTRGAPKSASACTATVTASLEAKSTPEHLRITTTGTCAAIVVALEPLVPGWRARVDGEERPLLEAELGFIAAEAPPGEHTVELYFDRTLIRTAAAISLAAALVALYLASLRSGSTTGRVDTEEPPPRSA